MRPRGETNHQQISQGSRGAWGRIAARAAVSALVVFGFAIPVRAATPAVDFDFVGPMPGGLSPIPLLAPTTNNGTSAFFKWQGVSPDYILQRRTNLTSGTWETVAGPTTGNTAVLPLGQADGFFRVRGSNPEYAGASACLDCHGDSHPETANWVNTAHASAFTTLKNIGQSTNPDCIGCHTVGYGAPTGFINEATTPFFTGVQCESCHGPGETHISSDGSLPMTSTRSAMLCGGCHEGAHHPTFTEWTTAGHSAVTESVAASFYKTDGSPDTARMNSCGACHSGAVRLEMIAAYKKNSTNVVWPTVSAAAETGITCAVCHETHQANTFTNVVGTHDVYTVQLRNAVTSTNFFSYSTSTNFLDNYKNRGGSTAGVCAQCHNARGASVASSSRPPHHSPQSNMMLGNIGVRDPAITLSQGAHWQNPRQCADCHTHRHEGATPNDPVYTGHNFQWTIEACNACHPGTSGPSGLELKTTIQAEISQRILDTKNLLDVWASTYNKATWAATFGPKGWEYTSAGQLSGNGVGPNATQQNDIPQQIKDARFNLYLVEHDNSKGVHNAPYARYLLNVATNKIAQVSVP